MSYDPFFFEQQIAQHPTETGSRPPSIVDVAWEQAIDEDARREVDKLLGGTT